MHCKPWKSNLSLCRLYLTLISNVMRNNQDNHNSLSRKTTWTIIFTEFSIFNNCQGNILTFLLFIASSKFRSSDIQGKMRNEKDGIDWWSFPIVSTLKSSEVANMKTEMWCISFNACDLIWGRRTGLQAGEVRTPLLEVFDFF